jgi:hypothetical protein
METKATILHADLDAFYASVEQLLDPSLQQRLVNVHFTPNSGHRAVTLECPLWAMCGRLRVGKDFLHERSIGRCSHVFGLT